MNPNTANSLSKEEQRYLLDLAHRSLSQYVQTKQVLKINIEEIPQNLREERACFVTYHKNGDLRGCIGSILPSQPLYLEVIERAVDAAVHDPRFSPITSEELPEIEIDISVLSLPQDIASYEEFIPGQHGVILSKYGHRAVFLPQVATEQGWDRSQTLTHLALKAGLSPNDWKSKATFQIFTAQVIEPKDLT